MQKITTIHPVTNTLMCTVCIARRMDIGDMSHVQDTHDFCMPRVRLGGDSGERV